jgi:hypothetical protein
LTSGLFHSNGNAAIFVQNAPVYRAPPQAALPSYRFAGCSHACYAPQDHTVSLVLVATCELAPGEQPAQVLTPWLLMQVVV